MNLAPNERYQCVWQILVSFYKYLIELRPRA